MDSEIEAALMAELTKLHGVGDKTAKKIVDVIDEMDFWSGYDEERLRLALEHAERGRSAYAAEVLASELGEQP